MHKNFRQDTNLHKKALRVLKSIAGALLLSTALWVTDTAVCHAASEETLVYENVETGYSVLTDLLKGENIAIPMKYITNLLLAVSLALLINFGLLNVLTRVRGVRKKKLLSNIEKKFTYTTPTADFVKQTSEYSPSSFEGRKKSRYDDGSGSNGRDEEHRF